MGKVDRLRNKVETLAVLFWALGHVRLYVLANTWPCTPAEQYCTAVHKTCPYLVIVGSNLSEDAPATPFFLSIGCNLWI